MTQLISKTSEWQALQAHCQDTEKYSIQELFSEDSRRAEIFSGELGHLFVDYSRHHITQKTLTLLVRLAEAAQLPQWRDKLFQGSPVNLSEACAASHFVWRDPGLRKQRDVAAEYQKVTRFAEQVRCGKYTTATGKPFTHLVSVGIGGSYIGNQAVCAALKTSVEDWGTPAHGIQAHFIDVGDSAALKQLCATLPPDETLCIVVSKSFSTPETQLAFSTLHDWFARALVDPAAVHRHFVFVSSNRAALDALGWAEAQHFLLPQSIGGRYSIWSAAALPTLIAIGCKRFEEFLQGAYGVDQHFLAQPLNQNLPVLLGLINLWYVNFYRVKSRAVIVYAHALKHFLTYLQQLEMESNGKSVTRDGVLCDYPTAPVIWGGDGLQGQHAFFQMLHQGTEMVPGDFILPVNVSAVEPSYAEMLARNFFAQVQALSMGAFNTDPHRNNPGNHPISVVLMRDLSAAALGSLFAFYEHQVFVEAVVWGINPFDQWGVELGKQIARHIDVGKAAEPGDTVGSADTQTLHRLLQYYQRWKETK